MCFDVDDGNPDTVRAIMRGLASCGIESRYVHVSTSGGKGYHVEVFFDYPVETWKLKRVYDWIIAEMSLDRKKVEFRPTNKQAIKLPLGVHHKTGNTCWFLDKETFAPIEAKTHIFDIEVFSAAKFSSAVRDLPPIKIDLTALRENQLRKESSGHAPIAKGSSANHDAVEAAGGSTTGNGTRHNFMVSYAVRMRNEKLSADECEQRLWDWYLEHGKDISSSTPEEVKADIKGILKWVYSDHFVPGCKRREDISADEALFCLQPRTKNARKILFIITAMCNVYGRCEITYDRLMRMFQCSRQTVITNVKNLVDAGYIQHVSATPKFAGGRFVRHCNVYYVNRDKRVQALDACGGLTDTRAPIRLGKLLDGFDDEYYSVLASVLPSQALLPRLAPSEKSLAENAVRNGRLS